MSADEAFIAGGIARRQQPISFANYRARILCAACNTHFKHLEDEVIPLLVPMARGRSLSLDQASQALLALWAHKTAIALIAATPELRDAVPGEHRRAVRTDGQVGADTWVGFYAWEGGSVLGSAQGAAVDRSTSATLDSYLAFLGFAYVGFCVIGFQGPLPPHQMVDGELPPVRQFWPPKGQMLHWPPSSMDNSVLPALLSFTPLRRV